MTYKITDFEAGDLNQYFGGTWVKHRTKKGTIRTGQITSFASDDLCIVESARGSRSIVSLSSIEWKGLIKPKCVSWNNYLCFVGPAGARSHKKPPTNRNTIALLYRQSRHPVLIGAGTSNGSMNSDLLRSYLEDDQYPDTAEAAKVLLQQGIGVMPLNETTGMFQDQEEGNWHGVEDGIIVFTGSRVTTIFPYIDGVYQNAER